MRASIADVSAPGYSSSVRPAFLEGRTHPHTRRTAWQRFSPAPPLLDPRFKFSVAALPGGLVLVVGGAEELAEVYDPTAAAFRPVRGAGAALRLFPAATPLADGSVLITGGYSGRGSQPTVWRYRAGP